MKRTALLLVLAVGASLPPATARADGSSLGVGIGVVKPEDLDSTLWLTGNLRLMLGRAFALEPEIGYWKKTETFLGIEGSIEDLSFGGNALIVIPTERVDLFAGGGAAAHRFKGKVGVPGFGSASETDTKLGFQILGGIDIEVSDTLVLFGAARWETIQGDKDTDPDEEDLTETKFYGGIRLRF